MRSFFVIALMLLLTASLAVGQSNDFVWVFLNTNPNRPEIPKAEAESLQAGHMANMGRLAKEGKLLAAGPFYTGGGIFVFRPTTMDSVKLWTATDPAIKAGRFVLEFLPYTPMAGSICAVGEKYTMTTYHSVRFKTAAKGPVDGAAVVTEAIAETMTDTLIAAGSFGSDGGFMIYKDSVEVSRFSSLRSIRDNSVSATVKKLYIAKGSFCEP